jgi:hypothetical protein
LSTAYAARGSQTLASANTHGDEPELQE